MQNMTMTKIRFELGRGVQLVIDYVEASDFDIAFVDNSTSEK